MNRAALFDYMGVKKVELLAPAGNYESFLGAIKAGADAIYLGGEKFSARAYADNFSDEEIIKAISYAHIFNRKVYMTINTLCKDHEMDELITYLDQFYTAGLDGVIIQDIGVFLRVKEHYPNLELHVSTQMTITGIYGAQFLKDMGAVRIVPARELSLTEIKYMKETTGLEIETFVHGAMCYCYSGQCLFSSIIGGRSGNRGRCAQPCRLPYTICKDGKKGALNYPLSLKDMCTISMIPQLINAGIDSFKIEGRMKKAEYAAGVTAIYRKYIDLYYEAGENSFQVEEKDIATLTGLYIRSDIQDGYYHKHNGADMITLHSPTYSGMNEGVLDEIRKQYIDNPLKKRIHIKAVFEKDCPVSIQMSCYNHKQELVSVCIEGEQPVPANNQPVTEENIRKGLQKLGNTNFFTEPEDIQISLQNGLFYSLKDINELRRKGIEALEEKLIYKPSRMQDTDIIDITDMGADLTLTNHTNRNMEPVINVRNQEADHLKNNKFDVLISSMAQLEAVLLHASSIDVVYIESDLLPISDEILTRCKQKVKIYIALPYVVRKNDYSRLTEINHFIEEADGCLIRNLETFGWLKYNHYNGNIRTDAGIYCFNQDTLNFWSSQSEKCCLPYELNAKELRLLTRFTENDKLEQIIYGRIPLMITANCIAKTAGKCEKGNGVKRYFINDRMNKDFPIAICCTHCYNIIYNSVPLSLHDKVIKDAIKAGKRIQFTTETQDEVKEVMNYFIKVNQGQTMDLPYPEYTLGHDKRGVE